MGFVSKRYKEAISKYDPTKTYQLDEALEILDQLPKAKFDETVEVAINLGVDPKHSDQMVRGAVTLPNGTGKSVRVLVLQKVKKKKKL